MTWKTPRRPRRITRFDVLVVMGMSLVVLTACERRGKVEQPICDVAEAGINDSTIGPLYIDEALPALRVRCPAIGDTQVAALGTASGTPALRLVVRGAPVIIRHDGAKVTALHVESPVFQTNDAIGVGTSIAKFRAVPGIRLQATQDAPYVLLDRRRCGVAYALSGWGQAPPLATDPPLDGGVLTAWPDSIVIRSITVSGCRGVTRDLRVDSVSEAIADSARARDTAAVTPVPPPLPVPEGAVEGARNDTAGIRATPRELEQLAARLDVPVQGVTRPQLRDTYGEARAGHAHEALDIPAARGTPVIAATDGRVIKLFNSKDGGLMVYTADASNQFILLYGHLDRYAAGIRDGGRLARGDVIGYVGTTGNAPIGTPHLHFAILRGRPDAAWWRGTAVNPYPLLVPRAP